MSEEQKLAGGFAFLHGVSWLTGIALGAFTTTSSAEDGRWASQNPSPAGREMLSAMTHPCAAFRGRGSSFCEWESLCYFLFTGFSHRLFPPGGTAVLKNKVQSFCGWNIFFFFFSFLTWRLKYWCFLGKMVNAEVREERKNISGRDGLCTGCSFFTSYSRLSSAYWHWRTVMYQLEESGEKEKSRIFCF